MGGSSPVDPLPSDVLDVDVIGIRVEPYHIVRLTDSPEKPIEKQLAQWMGNLPKCQWPPLLIRIGPTGWLCLMKDS